MAIYDSHLADILSISEEDRELWKMCDVRLMNRLQSIIGYSYFGNNDKVQELYESLIERYKRIDVSKLDSRFPVTIIQKVYQKLKDMRSVLGDHDKLTEVAKEFKPLGKEFMTPEYELYRSITNELERDG